MGKKKSDDATDVFASLLQRPRRRGEFHLAYQPEQAVEFAELVAKHSKVSRLHAAGHATDDELAAAKQTMDTFREEVGLITFVIEALTPAEYDELVTTHPATDEQKAEAKERGSVAIANPETFLPKLLEATCVEVSTPAGTMDGITAEQAKTLETANYSSAELDALYTAVANLHKSQATLDQLGNVSALMQGFAKS